MRYLFDWCFGPSPANLCGYSMCRLLLQVLKSLLYTAFFYQGEELGCLFWLPQDHGCLPGGNKVLPYGIRHIHARRWSFAAMWTSWRVSAAVHSREETIAPSPWSSLFLNVCRYSSTRTSNGLVVNNNYVPEKLLYLWHHSDWVRCYHIQYYARLFLKDLVRPLETESRLSMPAKSAV